MSGFRRSSYAITFLAALVVLTCGAPRFDAARAAVGSDVARRPGQLPILGSDLARRPGQLPILGSDLARRPGQLPILGSDLRFGGVCGVRLPLLGSDFNTGSVNSQDGLDDVNASAAHQTATGSGLVVAVLDCGFDLRHEFLDGHLVSSSLWRDVVDDDSDPQDLGNDTDDDSDGYTDSHLGHGTFVAGVVLAAAPGVTILPIRVGDDEGGVALADLVDGIEHAISAGADVINLSLVMPTSSQGLENALSSAESAGIPIVTAAGNEVNGPFDSPYLRNHSITVGAVDTSLAVASFSPNQSFVEVYAPGVDVVGPLGGDIEDSYATWDGTSFSTAFVTGAVAVLLEANSSLTPSQLLSVIQSSSAALSGVSGGLLDMDAALDE